MVIYDLVCTEHHVFEGWFKNSSDFLAQNNVGMVACPVCNSTTISRKVSAPKIGSSKNESIHNSVAATLAKSSTIESSVKEDLAAKPSAADGKLRNGDVNIENTQIESTQKDNAKNMRITTMPEQLEILRSFVEKNFEDVGGQFKEEVRKIHYGETDQRPIRGEATAYDIAELEEEGIPTCDIPTKLPKKNIN